MSVFIYITTQLSQSFLSPDTLSVSGFSPLLSLSILELMPALHQRSDSFSLAEEVKFGC